MGFSELLHPRIGKHFSSWLTCIEAKKSQHWKNIGIYDLIQLIKYDIVSLDMPMLMTSFLFWNRSLHALELPCGPITLTLLDIVAIISLKPLSKTYAIGLIEDQIERSEIDIDFSGKSYRAFIEKNAKDTEEVYDEEHIAFLMYWVSLHLTCTHSLQI